MVATLTFDTARLAELAPAGVHAGHGRRRVAGPPGRAVPRGARGGGRVRARGEARGVGLDDLTDDEFAAIHPALTPAVRDVLTVAGSLASPRSPAAARRPCGSREQRERLVAAAERVPRVGCTVVDARPLLWARQEPARGAQ